MSEKKPIKKKYSLRMRMMEINVGIALISFLLCGLLFILSVSFLVKTYINNDINFFLTETAENLEKRLEYIETTVTGVRESEILMDYLEKIKNPYCFRCGDAVVSIHFADKGNSLDSLLKNYFMGLKRS